MRRRINGWLMLCLLCALLLSGCQHSGDAEETAAAADASSENEPNASADSLLDAADMFTNRDYQTDYDESASAKISLEGTTASCSSNAVKIDGTTVTITDEGSYILSGTLTDGQIIVDAGKEDKVQLVLNGVVVTSSNSAAIYIRQADKVFITLADGSENQLSNGGTFASDGEDNIDAVIFSKEDLTLNGSGSLFVESPAGHGIVSKDDLVITGGSYAISTANQGLSGKDSVRIAGGTFVISAGTDGIHSENEEDSERGFIFLQGGDFEIDAAGDGISASGVLLVQGGNYSIVAGGGSANGSQERSSSWGWYRGSSQSQTSDTDSGTSMKGIKAGKSMELNGGSFVINAADDGFHSNASIDVGGGDFTIATGDDGFHADESLTITAGTITISESYEGLEGLYITIAGGEMDITASDDGLNAAGGVDNSGSGGRDGSFGRGWNTSSNGKLVISGGSIQIHASGDAIDANGTLEMTGGTVTASGPNSGDTSVLDYDLSGTISGGTFVGTGSSTMAENFSSTSTQGAIMATVSAQSAGTTVTLSDSAGNVLVEYQADQNFSCVIISCPEIQQGESYTLTIGSDAQTITMDTLTVSTSARGGQGFGSYGGRGGW